MSLKKVNAALINAFQSVPLGVPTTAVSYEGSKTFDPPDDAMWIKVHNMPADLNPVTMGENGEDEYAGFFQIDIHAPVGTGTGALHDAAWTLISAFQAGIYIWYQSQPVKIRRAVPSPIMPSDQFSDLVISVTVYWTARFMRNGNVAIPPPGGDTTPGYGQGGGGGQQDFEYLQSTPSALWIINHNLGRKVTTDVYTLGGVKVWADVVNISDNQVNVVLAAPMSGYAIIN